MEASVGDIVRSRNGRCEGTYFVIMSVENEYAFISNGSSRKSDKPKKKKLRHLEFGYGNSGYISGKIAKGDKITNTELRRELQEYTLQQ
ncbi:MAG: hypothetical protein PHE51_05115 [Eubacteriales bacterium]|nr:hypothetical protein [Eubacteriales bacterium]